jgi:hypothetical protein
VAANLILFFNENDGFDKITEPMLYVQLKVDKKSWHGVKYSNGLGVELVRKKYCRDSNPRAMISQVQLYAFSG